MNEQTRKVVQTPKSYAADGKTELHTLHGVGLVVSAVAFNKLYTTPPAAAQRPWVELTEQEELDCFSPNPVTHSKNVGAKLKEKNT
jgi:hypothetical protein